MQTLPLFSMSSPTTPVQPHTRRRESTLRLYDSIRAEYTRMMGVKRNGVRLWTQEYILQELADKFYKSPKTIENIIFNRV